MLHDDGKWKTVRQLTDYKVEYRQKPQKRNPKPKPKVEKESKLKDKVATHKAPVKQLPTKKVDPATMKRVKINDRTFIEVSREIPDEIAVANWLKKREAQLKQS